MYAANNWQTGPVPKTGKFFLVMLKTVEEPVVIHYCKFDKSFYLGTLKLTMSISCWSQINIPETLDNFTKAINQGTNIKF